MESNARCNTFKQSAKQHFNAAYGRGKRMVNDDKWKAVENYVVEWRSLSKLSEDVHLRELRKLAVNGELKTSKFRSICWSLLLEVLTGRSQSWLTQKRCDRDRYTELFRQFYINPRTAAEDDPLSQSDGSVWNQHFCDKELCTVIRQDVVRTIPGVEFFRRAHIQEIMTNILFCYARINPLMCYRQGMHEILAPIIFVMHCDHQAFLHIKEMSTGCLDAGLKELLDPKYLEADSYFIFAKIMKEIESFYRIHDLHPTATGYFPATPTISSTGENRSVSDLEVVARLNMIRDKILAKADCQLHNHLVQLDIPFPLFGIRWLRLLFGREFQLFDLLILWDAIFAEANEFELTDYIVVAMLISIRDEMLHSDYTTGLSCLMKYPSNIDVMFIIRHSLHLHAPDRYERPTNAHDRRPAMPPVQPNNLRQLGNRSGPAPRQPSKQPNQLVDSAAPRPVQSANASHNAQRSAQHRMKQSPSKSEQMRERVNTLQNSTAKATIRAANKPQLDQEAGVVDGYLENSAELLRMQLQNSQTVMTIARHKLRQYLAVFRKHIPGDSLHELHQAMDGMEELCELLNVKEEFALPLPTPVEPAFEANELAMSTNSNKTTPQPNATPAAQSNAVAGGSDAAGTVSAAEKTAPECVQAPSGTIPLHVNASKPVKRLDQDARIRREFVRKLKIECDNYGLAPVGVHEPSRVAASSDKDAGQSARYEVPDINLSNTAVRILGNRRELEMHEFSKKSPIPQSMDVGRSVSVPIVDPSGDRSTIDQ